MATAPTTSATTAATSTVPDGVKHGRTWLGHPRGLFLLFLVEMWERFSFYGMRALLVLYLVSVFSVRDLSDGIYSNQLSMSTASITESPDPADATKTRKSETTLGTRTQELFVVVGESPDPQDAVVVQNGPLGVVLERVESVPTSNITGAGGPKWRRMSDEIDVPIISRGTTVSEPKDWANYSHSVRITNPTEQPIKVVLQVRNSATDSRPYFTINGKPSEVSVVIPPLSSLDSTKFDTPEDPRFVATIATNNVSSGRFWKESSASTLYGWYTGLAYLFPILGGILADKLIGTHRSMLAGSILITLGHVILGLSGIGALAHNEMGMALFIVGLAVIVLGTGHFKPTVSVMVGQLYEQGDPRRDGAFTIFYMGINLGAFLCAFICGTLGEKVGWHWGFGSAAVGMIFGMLLYMWGKPRFLPGIGEPPASVTPARATSLTLVCVVVSLVLSAIVGLAYQAGVFGEFAKGIAYLQKNSTIGWTVVGVLLVGILAWVAWFLSINRREDRGPVLTIFIFMFFNAFFWIAFEQAGSSINVFTEQSTDRMLGSFEVPATWFQSVNAGLIFIFAPIFAWIWTTLGKRRMNPSQPVKIALGLILLGLGYLFITRGASITAGGVAKASMFWVFMTYFWHTMGELCLSPTGLSYVTKTAPARFVSLLMGIWFVSSFIANLGGGLIAAQVTNIESGKTTMPWSFGGRADFFFLFVVTSIGAGVLILVLTPILKKLMRPGIDA